MRQTTQNPSNAKVKNNWKYTYTLAVCFRVMHMNNFPFLHATEMGRPGVISVILNSHKKVLNSAEQT
jgi:hypothetical protein